MKKLRATDTTTGVVLVMSASGASAGSPTCEDMFGSSWKNHHDKLPLGAIHEVSVLDPHFYVGRGGVS